MYEAFFEFREKPFSLLPDPGFLYMSRQHQQAFTLLEYGLMNQAGFIILTGDIGSGKTTLMRHLLARLDESVTVGLISNTHQSLGELMDWVCMAFDISGKHESKLEKYQAFIEFLLAAYGRGSRVLLIVDEAQNLGIEKLEELRLLSNVNAGKDLVLQLMLLGQPQLRDLLRQPELEQFAQRVTASYHIGPLDPLETESYIRHRLFIAGGTHEVFSHEACLAVHHFSKGIPRLINLICDTALVYAFGEEERFLTGAFIEELVAAHAPHLLISVDLDRPEALSRPDAADPGKSSDTDQRLARSAPEDEKRLEPSTFVATPGSSKLNVSDPGSTHPAPSAPQPVLKHPSPSLEPRPLPPAALQASSPAPIPMKGGVRPISDIPSSIGALKTVAEPRPQLDAANRYPAASAFNRPSASDGASPSAFDSGLHTPLPRAHQPMSQSFRDSPRRAAKKRMLPMALSLLILAILSISALWLAESKTGERVRTGLTGFFERAVGERPNESQETIYPAPLGQSRQFPTVTTPPDVQPSPRDSDPELAPEPEITDESIASLTDVEGEPSPDLASEADSTARSDSKGLGSSLDLNETSTSEFVGPHDTETPHAGDGSESAVRLESALGTSNPERTPGSDDLEPNERNSDISFDPSSSTVPAQTVGSDSGSENWRPTEDLRETKPEPAQDMLHQLSAISANVEKHTDGHLTINLGDLIRFPDGGVTLDEEGKAILDAFTTILKDYNDFMIQVVAHTDSSGSESVNHALSSRRAENIAAYFMKSGIERERLSFEGRAHREPRADPAEERLVGPWVNRRVEIDLIRGITP